MSVIIIGYKFPVSAVLVRARRVRVVVHPTSLCRRHEKSDEAGFKSDEEFRSIAYKASTLARKRLAKTRANVSSRLAIDFSRYGGLVLLDLSVLHRDESPLC